MGGIADKHVEWAVVNRLKAMLDDPPETSFNVTQSFALFSTIVLWSKNRAWVGGNAGARRPWKDPADHQAHDVREELRRAEITESPWLLSRASPSFSLVGAGKARGLNSEGVNADFDSMRAEDFFKWLRDALAHGDGRTISPIHHVSQRSQTTLLSGMRVEFEETRGSNRRLTLSLYHGDMRRLGSMLADLFCRSLSGGDRYFEQEVGTALITEAA